MPSGIILSSGSIGTKQEDIQAVLNKHGYEVDQPEAEEVQSGAEETGKLAEQVDAQTNNGQNGQQTGKKTRIQRAVDRVTEKLQRDLEAANAKIAELEKGKTAQPIVEEPKVKKPVRADFPEGQAGQDAYETALIDFGYEDKRAKEIAEESSRAQLQKLKETVEAYQDRVAEFKEDHPDWDDLFAGETGKIPLKDSVELAIIEMENGPQVTYYLVNNPEYAKRLHAMNELSAVLEVGRLSERLNKSASSNQRANGGNSGQVTPRKLPAPVEPSNTSAVKSTVTTADAAASGSLRAYKAARRRR